MAFILSTVYPANWAFDLTAFSTKWAAYRSYLVAHQAQFPPAAYAYASADWHYNAEDPRCPHDAWVETLTMQEEASGDRRQFRRLTIHVQLLGAYHNGMIAFHYSDVTHYALHKPAATHAGNHEHGDWSVDEVRLSSNQRVIHEVEFAHGGRWYIECGDLQYTWQPFA